MAIDLRPQQKDEKYEQKGNGIYCTVHELLYEGKKSLGKTLHLRRSHAIRSGVRRGALRGRGMEFFESRAYVPQDEMRNIDWKVSARLNGLFTKVFIEERSRPVFLAIDLRKSMFFGSKCCFKSVLAAKIAARLATVALDSGDYFGGTIFDDYHEYECPMSGRQMNLARFIGLLAMRTEHCAQGTKEPELSWSVVLNRMVNRVQAGSVVFLVSDFFGFPDLRSLLYQLRKKADVFALAIADPLEAQLPSLGKVGMAFAHEEIIFDSSNKLLARKYDAWFKEKNQRLFEMFLSQNIPLISFSTAEDLNRSMDQIFLGRW